jgi:hypothetical protein
MIDLKDLKDYPNSKWDAYVAALRAALAQPQQQPLTDEQIDRIADGPAGHDRYTFARAIERAHGIGEPK